MSTTTISKPPAGQKVRITAMPGDAHTGEFGIVSTEYDGLTHNQIGVVIDGSHAPTHQRGVWIVDEWEVVTPQIGDKVIPLPDDGNWYGMNEEYRNAVGTVVETADYSDLQGRRWVAAEFPSIQKPDDTVRFSFYWCKVVTAADEYRPSLGDVVRMTGYLDSTGIIDCPPRIATVTGIDGDIWTVIVDEREYVTGPGYVTLVQDGETLTVSTPALPHEEPRIITELREEAETLRRELARANERVSEYSNRAGKWERDFMRSWERIAHEAVRRSWCSEYEQIVDEVQENLEIGEIPARRRRVRKQMRIKAEVYRDVWVWVDEEADDDEDPDNWYESETDDEDDNLGSEWADDQVRNEYENNGFDSVEYESI